MSLRAQFILNLFWFHSTEEILIPISKELQMIVYCYWNIEDDGSISGSGRSTGTGTGYPLQYSSASLVAQLVKNPHEIRRPEFNPWVGKIPWRRE